MEQSLLPSLRRACPHLVCCHRTLLEHHELAPVHGLPSAGRRPELPRPCGLPEALV